MNHYMSVLLAGVCVILLSTACGPVSTMVPPAEQPLVPTDSPAAPAPTEFLPTPSPEPTASATALPSTESLPTPSPEPSPTVATEGANADVLQVRAVESADGSWTFHVTVEHPDSGWEDYADGWDVLTLDGTVLKPDPESPFTRLLLHPHENEQPFTRSQSGIVMPAGVTQVRVRAHDLVDGFGGREVVVDLAVAAGEGFEVERSE